MKRGRLLNVVRYIMERCPDGMEFGKLSTLIYLADREAYLRLGQTITGHRHIKRQWGIEVEGLRRVVAYMRRRGELA